MKLFCNSLVLLGPNLTLVLAIHNCAVQTVLFGKTSHVRECVIQQEVIHWKNSLCAAVRMQTGYVKCGGNKACEKAVYVQLSEQCLVETPRFSLEVPSDNWTSSEVVRWKAEIYFSIFMSPCMDIGWKGRSQDGVWLMRGNNVSQHWGSVWFVNKWWMNMGFQLLLATGCQTDMLLPGCFAVNHYSVMVNMYKPWFPCGFYKALTIPGFSTKHSHSAFVWLPGMLIFIAPTW